MHFAVSRRHFLALFALASAPLGACESPHFNVSATNELQLPKGIKVVWLQGAGCSGCTISFLNLLSQNAPETAAEALLEVVVVGYHPVLMAAAGETAADIANTIYGEGNYLLVIEGGVPMAFDGMACGAWTVDGKHATMRSVVKRFADRAAGILAVGTCASFGGVSAAGANPAGVLSVQKATGAKNLINLPGCPANPAWIIWGLSQFLAWQSGSGAAPSVDHYFRPTQLFGRFVHDQCARRNEKKTVAHGTDHACLFKLGCQGPKTRAPCPDTLWNGGRNWCVDANGLCIGCTEPGFPGTALTG